MKPKNQRKTECVEKHVASMPSSYEELQKMLIARMPRPIRLPPFDVRATIDEFGREHGLRVKHCSALLGPLHNKSLRAVEEAYALLGDRAKTTEFNIEAVILYMNAVFQLGTLTSEDDDMHIHCYNQLHAIIYQGRYVLPIYDIEDAGVLRNMLKTLLPDEECVICLADLSEEACTHPFICGHGLCVTCGNDQIQVCPICKSKCKQSVKVLG